MYVYVCIYYTWIHRQTSNISCSLVGNNTIADHSEVVGASPLGAALTTSSFSTLRPGFNGLGKDNYKKHLGFGI